MANIGDFEVFWEWTVEGSHRALTRFGIRAAAKMVDIVNITKSAEKKFSKGL